MDSVVVVQKNKTRYLVNRLQIERFARSQNQDIRLFPADYFRTKKDGGRIVEHEDFFSTHRMGKAIAQDQACYLLQRHARWIVSQSMHTVRNS